MQGYELNERFVTDYGVTVIQVLRIYEVKFNLSVFQFPKAKVTSGISFKFCLSLLSYIVVNCIPSVYL